MVNPLLLLIFLIIGFTLVGWVLVAGITCIQDLLKRQGYRDTKNVLKAGKYILPFIGVMLGVLMLEQWGNHLYTSSDRSALLARYEEILEAAKHEEYETIYTQYMSASYRRYESLKQLRHIFSYRSTFYIAEHERIVRISWDKTKGKLWSDNGKLSPFLTFAKTDGIWYLNWVVD